LSFGSVGIFGVGAIGGSIGLRARSNGARVVGADRDETALEEARRRGAIDAAAPALELPSMVSVLVIAAHLEPTLREIERLASVRNEQLVLVIDVASVKLPVVRAAAGLGNFVATHPMAGTQRSGVAAARADLFEGRAWAYVPAEDDELNSRVQAFIASMGAVPFAISAEEHDRVVALTSHVPQIVASCYAELFRAVGSDAERLTGPVARELLRISGMSFAMWRDILAANAGNIEPQLRALVRQLDSAADSLARGDVAALKPLFGELIVQ
jgi:prephenate dehydrogenase